MSLFYNFKYPFPLGLPTFSLTRLIVFCVLEGVVIAVQLTRVGHFRCYVRPRLSFYHLLKSQGLCHEYNSKLNK